MDVVGELCQLAQVFFCGELRNAGPEGFRLADMSYTFMRVLTLDLEWIVVVVDEFAGLETT